MASKVRILTTEIDALKRAGLIDAGVLLYGFESGWVSAKVVSDYAATLLSAGTEHSEVAELVAAQYLDHQTVVELLQALVTIEARPTASADEARRRWMYACLVVVAECGGSYREKCDRIHALQGFLGFSEELWACSPYYMTAGDRVQGDQHTASAIGPVEAMLHLISRLREEWGVSDEFTRDEE